jgi:hypothetical protein
MRKSIRDESVDLCYIDPPFNSQRDYNQIYNGIGDKQDQAQAQAFTDTWSWDHMAIAGYDEIISNAEGRFSPQVVGLIKGQRTWPGQPFRLPHKSHAASVPSEPCGASSVVPTLRSPDVFLRRTSSVGTAFHPISDPTTGECSNKVSPGPTDTNLR